MGEQSNTWRILLRNDKGGGFMIDKKKRRMCSLVEKFNVKNYTKECLHFANYLR